MLVELQDFQFLYFNTETTCRDVKHSNQCHILPLVVWLIYIAPSSLTYLINFSAATPVKCMHQGQLLFLNGLF